MRVQANFVHTLPIVLLKFRGRARMGEIVKKHFKAPYTDEHYKEIGMDWYGMSAMPAGTSLSTTIIVQCFNERPGVVSGPQARDHGRRSGPTLY